MCGDRRHRLSAGACPDLAEGRSPAPAQAGGAQEPSMPVLTSPPSPGGPPTFHFKASRQPMLWAALAHALGIVAGVYLWRPVLWWVVASVAFVPSAAYFARRRSALGWTLALGTFFLA